MKPRTKKILNFLFIFGVLAIVLLVGFNGQEMSGAVDALKSIAPKWIVLCALAYVLYVALDAFSIWYFLHRQGYAIGMGYALYVSISGMYYSNITPGATGGQPMQVYYLKKREVPIGIGTSALTVKFFCFQFMLAVISTILWIRYSDFIGQQAGSSIWILIVGYVYNAISVTFVLMMAVSKRLVRFFIKLFIRIGAKLRLCKDPEASLVKWEDVLSTFHASVMMMRRHPLDFLVQLAAGAVQLLVQMLSIYFIYLAFDLTGATYAQLTALGVMLYVSAAYTPLPGASGAQEGVFALYFSKIFPGGMRLMALLLWRFFTYYLSLIVGAVVSVVHGFRPHRRSKGAGSDGQKLT